LRGRGVSGLTSVVPAIDVSSGRFGANVPGFRGSDVGRRNLGLVLSALSLIAAGEGGGGLRRGGVGGGRGAATTWLEDRASAGTLMGCSGGGVDSGALGKIVGLEQG